MSSLFEKVVSGGKWVGALRVIKKITSIVKTVALARLLAPDDFGLFAIALLVVTGFQEVTLAGVFTSVIQAEDIDDDYLDTAFWLSALRGTLLAGAIYLSAPLAAEFFSEADAAPLVRLLALAPLISGFMSVGLPLLKREMRFKRYSVFQTSHVLVEVAASIVLAIVLRSAWALVFGHLIGKVARTVLIYLFHSYRPSLNFSWSRCRQIVDFGVWMLLGSIAGYISLQLDDILLGRWEDAAALGLYQLAFMIGNILAQQLSGIIHQVMFPALAEIQNDRARLRNVFERTFQFTATVLIPSGIGLAVISPHFVPVFFGEKWIGMITMVSILSISAIFRGLSKVQLTLFVSNGRPNLKFYGTAVRLAVLAAAVYPAYVYFGADGIAVAAAISTFSSLVLYFILSRRMLGPELQVLTPTIPAVVGTVVMLPTLLVCQHYVVLGNAGELSLLILVGIVVYTAVFLPLDSWMGYGSSELVKRLARKALGKDESNDMPD